MSYITLEEAKAHVVCEHDEDDALILSLIEVAERSVADMINQPLADVMEGGKLPPPLVHAMKIILGNLYLHREGTVQGRVASVQFTLSHLVLPYRKER